MVKSITEAIICVKANHLDIYECGEYNYALIEEVKEGLYNTGKHQELWYTVECIDSLNYKVEYVEKPEFFKMIRNFSMG